MGVGKTTERIGEARPLASVADDEIGEVLELLWGTAAVNTWNPRRAGVLSWLGWCREHGYEGPMVPAWTKRLAVPDSETPARSKTAIVDWSRGARCTCGRRLYGECCTKPPAVRRRSSA